MRILQERLQPGSPAERRVALAALLFAAAVLLLDQGSKFWMEHHFQLHESRVVIPDFFSLTLVRNQGAAWSILSGYGWFLLVIAGVVAAGVIRFFRSLAEGCAERYWALLLVLSGVAGNSIDRLWRGAVVDFFDFHYRQVWSYPVFNVADIAICTGIFLYVFSNLLRRSPIRKDSADADQNDRRDPGA